MQDDTKQSKRFRDAVSTLAMMGEELYPLAEYADLCICSRNVVAGGIPSSTSAIAIKAATVGVGEHTTTYWVGMFVYNSLLLKDARESQLETVHPEGLSPETLTELTRQIDTRLAELEEFSQAEPRATA